MNNPKYLWYKLKPFASSAGEKYDEKKDSDLIDICRDIPDVLFQVLKTPRQGTTITLRVPEDAGKKIEGFESFGHELREVPMAMRIEVITTMGLAGKSAYPLVRDTKNVSISNLFSSFRDIPYGVFGIKMSHANSRIITKQYNAIRKRNSRDGEKNTSGLDPFEKFARQKSECTSFFYTEIFFGVRSIHDEHGYEKFIPCRGKERKPNGLVSKKRMAFADKHLDRANQFYEKMILSGPVKSTMVLSDSDLSPFVRFPENPYSVGLDSAQTPTTSNISVSESDFDGIDAEFRE